MDFDHDLYISSKENIGFLQNSNVEGAAQTLISMFNNQCFQSTFLMADNVASKNGPSPVSPLPLSSSSFEHQQTPIFPDSEKENTGNCSDLG